MKSFLRGLAIWLILTVILLLGMETSTLNADAQSPGNPDTDSSGQIENGEAGPLGGGGMPLLYQFTGACDDGGNGKVVTTLHCSNPGSTQANMLLVLFTQDGKTYFFKYYAISAGGTYTISTHNTNLYVEDYSMNTGVLNQGNGKVYSDSGSVICTAQILDPTGYPPSFVSRLRLYTSFGYFADEQQEVYLPMIRR